MESHQIDSLLTGPRVFQQLLKLGIRTAPQYRTKSRRCNIQQKPYVPVKQRSYSSKRQFQQNKKKPTALAEVALTAKEPQKPRTHYKNGGKIRFKDGLQKTPFGLSVVPEKAPPPPPQDFGMRARYVATNCRAKVKALERMTAWKTAQDAERMQQAEDDALRATASPRSETAAASGSPFLPRTRTHRVTIGGNDTFNLLNGFGLADTEKDDNMPHVCEIEEHVTWHGPPRQSTTNTEIKGPRAVEQQKDPDAEYIREWLESKGIRRAPKPAVPLPTGPALPKRTSKFVRLDCPPEETGGTKEATVHRWGPQDEGPSRQTAPLKRVTTVNLNTSFAPLPDVPDEPEAKEKDGQGGEEEEGNKKSPFTTTTYSRSPKKYEAHHHPFKQMKVITYKTRPAYVPLYPGEPIETRKPGMAPVGDPAGKKYELGFNKKHYLGLTHPQPTCPYVFFHAPRDNQPGSRGFHTMTQAFQGARGPHGRVCPCYVVGAEDVGPGTETWIPSGIRRTYSLGPARYDQVVPSLANTVLDTTQWGGAPADTNALRKSFIGVQAELGRSGTRVMAQPSDPAAEGSGCFAPPSRTLSKAAGVEGPDDRMAILRGGPMIRPQMTYTSLARASMGGLKPSGGVNGAQQPILYSQHEGKRPSNNTGTHFLKQTQPWTVLGRKSVLLKSGASVRGN
uniref:Uncharacterized protein n=1 Tax=Chromera velia CCMP2878 TaxID=1169474 RepID=A0A0G4HI77_9ALVE|eukprot:Cvel_27731.t1-p1 / transcript=Cvel_27731.t1 / gene=Cvel_27731 / organism=Chromera_velia_CCMP2878 / gene_product=hypothetical protein / transcript_product=hypothetical protein / location=Cvel_scaffold3510:1897-4930(-) / protein_length=675 / sequence_SO=supercontig / SO=protein_coding / is_pseudo=false